MAYSSSYRLVLIVLCLCAVALTTGSARAQAQAGRVFLPLVLTDAPRSTFGIEMSSVSDARGLSLVVSSGTHWVRRNGLLWSDVEPVKGGGYNWQHPRIQRLEREMIDAAQHGISLIIVVRGSPDWATAPYTADCAPVSSANYAAFGRFVAALAARYGQQPYHVKYWELGNEPDAPLQAKDNVFGCWGQPDDLYYGGRAYGEMLKVVYPAIKAADPAAQVLNGGLLLDQPYDPAQPERRLGRFFEGILAAGAGASFDILSFHAYIFWNPAGPSPLGAAVDWRIGYLQNLLRAYGVPAKPMIRTEGALLCVAITPDCRWAQANFLARSFARSLRDGLMANIWYIYDSDSYHNTAMIEPGDVFVPRPAYYSYRQVARLLSGASYVGALVEQPEGVEGYRFRRGTDTIVVFWSDRGAQARIDVPAGAQVSCYDRDGGSVSCAPAGTQVVLAGQSSPQFVVIRR